MSERSLVGVEGTGLDAGVCSGRSPAGEQRDSRTIRLWAPVAKKAVAEPGGDIRRRWRVLPSVPTAWLASGANDRLVILWNPKTGEPVAGCWGTRIPWRVSRSSPDGTRLAKRGGGWHDLESGRGWPGKVELPPSHPGPGAPWWGVQGATPSCPPEAVSSDTVGRECVSKRGHRVVCPLTNPRGLQSQRCGVRSPQRWYHKGDIRCLPRFLTGSASGGKGWAPLDPGCRGTLGLS